MKFQFLKRFAAVAGIATAAILLALAANPRIAVNAADKPAVAASGWNPEAAARYLDSREVWWQTWDRTQKDHGTYCVSCHTQATYALARPVRLPPCQA